MVCTILNTVTRHRHKSYVGDVRQNEEERGLRGIFTIPIDSVFRGELCRPVVRVLDIFTKECTEKTCQV